VGENIPSHDQNPKADHGPDIDYEDFVRTRKRYWMNQARRLDSTLAAPNSDANDLNDSEYTVSAAGPDSVFAVFEDEGDVGWFYLYDPLELRILNCTHVYNRSNVRVDSTDIDFFWSDDGHTSAVAVWAQMRAFLGVNNGVQLRAPIQSRDAPGIPANQWPSGFEYALLK
jgi:hypothetical protein